MQEERLSFSEQITYLGGALILLCVFFFALFVFWQSGELFSSCLNFLGYTFVALLLGSLANGAWVLCNLVIAFCSQLFDRIFDFAFPTNKQSR